MNLNKMFLTVFSFVFLFQVSLAYGDDGLIKIKNASGYIIKRIKCWDSRGRKTHSSGRLLSPNQRSCDDSSYLKVEGIEKIGGDKFARRFRRARLGCTGSSKMLCIKAKGTVFNPSFETRCELRQYPDACR